MMINKLLQYGRRQLHTVVSREIIKPSSPTPSIFQTYNLSELDQVFHHTSMPIVLLYPHDVNCSLTAHEKATILKKSLSQSLTKYYPFAGRLPTPIKPSYVECNDHGVVFVEAKNDSQLRAFEGITQEDETMDQLFSDNIIGHNSPQSKNLLGVQLNHFACGGVAVAVSMSHIIGDACTLGWFVNHWASVARYGSTEHKVVQPLNPHYIHSIPRDSGTPESQSNVINHGYPNWVTRKLVFPNSKLNDLKNKVIALAVSRCDQPINNPTRVEVLTSLLYKTAVAAATKRSGCFDSLCLLTLADIRSKFAKKLPQTTVGNLVSAMMVPTRDPSETSLSFLVSKIKKEKLQLEGIQSVQQAAENMNSLLSKLGNDQDLGNVTKRIYTGSSLCGFPFDKADFGWGKPKGVTFQLSKVAYTSGFALMDTLDGDGIEASVILDKEEMEMFENDKEMLSFCQINML